MIIDIKNREAVIANIRQAIVDEDFYRKVEINDPVLTAQEEKEITDGFLQKRKTITYKFKSFITRTIANVGSDMMNRNTEIVGDVDAEVLKNGAIITSNHFSPLENTIIRYWVRKKGMHRLNIVSQVTNFAMKGIIGFLMNYADSIPLSVDMRYLTKDFISVIKELMDQKEVVLIYPEQEMWFQYRKPRPLKRGAYFFAAQLNRPIVSCFVEMIDLKKREDDRFSKVKYRLHILGVIYPDAQKGVKENSKTMCDADYELKKAAYEKAYHKKLDYAFQKSDIAGWKPMD